MKKLCEFKIRGYTDRRNLATILADNGYPVSVENRKKHSWEDDDLVVVVMEKAQKEG